jgi:hypothetical protein
MVIEKWGITADNIYNFDEKGFLMGFGRTLKRIMTVEALKAGRITKSKQDGSREFISILATISAIGRWIPPLLIYKGESGDLMSTWVDEVTSESQAHFTVSNNGWSNNAIGLIWLQKIFERYTKPKRTTTKRLLIVDGHSSHINMAFVDWADEHGIILLILPPHTTHRLQPLDVGLFQPLSTYYSVELNQVMHNTGGIISMSKRFFWPLFKRAWDKAFTEENIQGAFRKAGIWPTNGIQVIAVIQRPIIVSPVQEPGELKVPRSAKSLRRFKAAYERNPTADKVKTLFSTTLQLSAQLAVLKHQNNGLIEAIDLQKKKNKKGVRLNLCGEPNKNTIDCYSPAQVVKARLFQEQKEEEKEAEEKRKYDNRVKRAANALKKAKELEEKQARAAARQLVVDLKKANPAAKKSSTAHAKSVGTTPKKNVSAMPKARKAPVKARLPPKSPAKRLAKASIEEVVVSGVAGASASGRTIRLPQRFR